ncbi:MAG: glutamine--fructose-6-phosphate transaminase (isomerizing) [bacterium]|nr:glutamine--fructose-6-phosphate transaminase (isomerizing) [bacterium]
MCGIIGYVGSRQAKEILIDGLTRLEYRGYDSAGLVTLNDGAVIVKTEGKVDELKKRLENKPVDGKIGIAHTRWATHGEPSERNAHPHSDEKRQIFVVHNGIIENYKHLKDELIKKGHKFASDTDTEVLAHLIEEDYKGNLEQAVASALSLVRGTYGLAVISCLETDKIVVARSGSPLLVGLGNDENIVASDVSAIIRYTKEVVYLEEREIAVVKKDGFHSFSGKSAKDRVALVEWEIEQAEKGGFPHFMLKEIFEQPKVVEDSIRGRLIEEDGLAKLGGLEEVKDRLGKCERLIITACGTAYYAGLVGEYLFEEYGGLPTEVEYASEFRYRKPIIERDKTAFLAISQSGETADTLAAVCEAKRKGALVLGIVNVVGSTIARETDAGVYNHAGPEIGVASTKAFISQLAVLFLFTLMIGRQREMSFVTGRKIAGHIKRLPNQINSILTQDEKIKEIAQKYAKYNDFLYISRKYNFPIALEGALKLKEISYIHAEGYPSGEMKHGPIALIDENFPTIAIIPKDSVYEKTISNLEEIKARKGKIIAVATEGDEEIQNVADDVIYIPETLEMLTPIFSVVPLQLLAYYIAVIRGKDVDKPRNLAKSVTVE